MTELRPVAPAMPLDLLRATSQEESNAAWAEARRLGAVVRDESHEGHWLVTRYEEVCQAFRNWQSFSSARTDPDTNAISVTRGRVPMLVPEELDPPEWFPMRRVLSELLTPAAAERRRSRARHWSRHYLDRTLPAGRCDLVRDFVVPVPAAVTMEMLGFPESEWLPIAGVFHDVSAYPLGHPVRERAITRFGEVMGAITREIESRRAHPGDDTITALVNARVEGQPIAQADLERLVFMVIAGGVDTTTAVTAAALLHLGRDTDLRSRLQDDATLMPNAVEEFLRMYPPARTHARTVTQDVELGGCLLLAGDRLVLSELSANYDASAFEQPGTFRPDRFPNRHVTFGMGIHRCVGSHLARIMLTEMLSVALDMIPDYQVEEDGLVEYPSWTMIGGWTRMPVTFSRSDDTTSLALDEKRPCG